MSTTVPAIMELGPKYKNRILRVLLDTGSDGDLMFLQKGRKSYVPFKERYAPQTWRTSNGLVCTTRVANLDLIFPEFSKSKVAKIKPDVVMVEEDAPKPTYDIIIVI